MPVPLSISEKALLTRRNQRARILPISVPKYGVLYRSDDPEFHAKFKHEYIKYLPYRVYARDVREIAIGWRDVTNRHTGEVKTVPMSKERAQAVRYRYIRMTPQHNKAYRQIMVVDIDVPGLVEVWSEIEGFPRPNFIVINVVKGTCQYHYLLDSPVYEHQLDLFKDVRNLLISYLPDGHDWSCPDINRSPFFTVGKETHTTTRVGWCRPTTPLWWPSMIAPSHGAWQT
jgi:hypothetical protein